MVTIIAGIAIGDAMITPPAAANPKPIFLNILKNFGVGVKRLGETGCSGFGTLDELLEFNEAGRGGKKLSKEEILQDYCRTKAEYTK